MVHHIHKFFTQTNIPIHRWLRVRLLAQIGFLVLILWIGFAFIRFTDNVRDGVPVPVTNRPPGVEGFLPISSLMELWLWLKSGSLAGVHPAGVVIIAFAIGSAWLMRRGFCSWLCPVGTVSEILWRLGQKLHLNRTPPKWVDIPLRGIKFLLLGFFLYAILGMSAEALQMFLQSSYNKVSDIKMLAFFRPPTPLTLKVLGVLGLLSLVVKNAWCRYLCPYGALLGLFARISPYAVRRTATTCIDCGKCDKACPSWLPVATSARVASMECLACQQCTAVCPVAHCLEFSAPKKTAVLKPAAYGIVFVALFLLCVGIARFSGNWFTSIRMEEFQSLIGRVEHMGHPTNLSEYHGDARALQR